MDFWATLYIHLFIVFPSGAGESSGCV